MSILHSGHQQEFKTAGTERLLSTDKYKDGEFFIVIMMHVLQHYSSISGGKKLDQESVSGLNILSYRHTWKHTVAAVQ